MTERKYVDRYGDWHDNEADALKVRCVYCGKNTRTSLLTTCVPCANDLLNGCRSVKDDPKFNVAGEPL
jgi:hypothetical protein